MSSYIQYEQDFFVIVVSSSKCTYVQQNVKRIDKHRVQRRWSELVVHAPLELGILLIAGLVSSQGFAVHVLVVLVLFFALS